MAILPRYHCIDCSVVHIIIVVTLTIDWNLDVREVQDAAEAVRLSVGRPWLMQPANSQCCNRAYTVGATASAVGYSLNPGSYGSCNMQPV